MIKAYQDRLIKRSTVTCLRQCLPIKVVLSYHSTINYSHPPFSLSLTGDLVDRYSVLLDDVQDSQSVMIEDTKQAHNLLIELQNVLLNGQENAAPNTDDSPQINANATNYEQVRDTVID